QAEAGIRDPLVTGVQTCALPISPARAAVARLPYAAARDSHGDAPRIARVDADGMDAGIVVTAADPLRALGLFPKRVYERPGRAEIGRASCRQRASVGRRGPRDRR